MRIVVGSDHAGLSLKRGLVERMRAQGHEVEDVGTHDNTSCDYPDFAVKVGEAVRDGRADRGLLCCGTGQGMAMTANRVAGVRAQILEQALVVPGLLVAAGADLDDLQDGALPRSRHELESSDGGGLAFATTEVDAEERAEGPRHVH